MEPASGSMSKHIVGLGRMRRSGRVRELPRRHRETFSAALERAGPATASESAASRSARAESGTSTGSRCCVAVLPRRRPAPFSPAGLLSHPPKGPHTPQIHSQPYAATPELTQLPQTTPVPASAVAKRRLGSLTVPSDRAASMSTPPAICFLDKKQMTEYKHFLGAAKCDDRKSAR